VIQGDGPAYHLPGTTGWGPVFGGVRTVLWNPTVQAPGVRSNQFTFDITGTTNIPITVEASSNLSGGQWARVQSGTLTNGVFHFRDADWTNYPARFYRIAWP
jgi:hypothetical protein